MPSPPTIRSIFSTRRVRIVSAVLLIGLSIWALAPYIAYRVSSSAFINAEMMRVTAPISGYLSSELPHKGEFVDRASKLTLIKSYAVDRRRLVELESQQSAAKERAAFDDKQLAEIATLDGELEKRTRAYRDGMITRLGHEIAEAQAESTGCLKEDLHRRDIGTRMQGLVEVRYHITNPLSRSAGGAGGYRNEVRGGGSSSGAPAGGVGLIAKRRLFARRGQ